MKSKFVSKKMKYDGSQLRPLFSYMTHDLLGDSIVSWVGPCDVTVEHMKDGEDLKAKEKIKGDLMLHFIVELFDGDLFGAVAVQRLLSSIAKDVLLDIGKLGKEKVSREGDDIFVGKKKLSISIATRSTHSSLIHFAVNCVNKGTPIPTCSLEDF